MATVTFQDASRTYPGTDKPAVDALNLQIGDGEFLVLVGPSGCGKSTSLRMLAGLEDIDAGAILINDEDVSNKPPKARDIAMVFQNYALYPHMTVYENMAFALKLRKTPKAEIDAAVRKAAKMLHLEEYLGRKPKALSGGQRQRVAMGRAIVREPQVFLMDEPLSNLDAKLRVQTRSEIAGLQADLGITTVYVTHDQVEAMTMGHRVAVLNEGLLQQCDTPRKLYDEPANVFVASFIGSPAMNIKTVALTDDGAAFGAMALPLTREQVTAARAKASADPTATATAAAEGSPADASVVSTAKGDLVTIGFRPEDCDLISAEDTGGLPIVVDLVEELGSDAYVYGHADINGGSERFVVRTDGRKTPQMGETVRIKPRADHHHIFHTVSGERIN